MVARLTLRAGPESTDLVFAEGGGTRAEALRAGLRAASSGIVAPLVLAGFSALLAIVMIVAGADLGTILMALGFIAAGEVALFVPLAAHAEVTTVRRVEFAPPAAPERMRFVRAGRPDPWVPVAHLGRIVIAHRMTEPYEGDRQPAEHTYTLRMVMRHNEQAPYGGPYPEDPRELAEALRELLAPAGVRIEAETTRSVRPKLPPPGSGSEPGPGNSRSSRWTSGGSASANSGGG
ncbi:hypothetical protein [Kitasatospora sp. NPDC093558]|uniref:hypothetical protein n=1 Tax=Kitasatospora sp. NPDC093558 TaxID=3155201 RepID=UPI003423F831